MLQEQVKSASFRSHLYRIYSSEINNLPNVAFVTPAGKIVLIVINTANQSQTFNIKFAGKMATNTLNPGAVATYTW